MRYLRVMSSDPSDRAPSPRAAEFLAEMEAMRSRPSAAARLGIPEVLICGPPHEWETEYLPAGSATWHHLAGAVAEAERKGRDGQAVTEALREAARRLRPLMEDHPERTIDEALGLEAGGGGGPGS